MCYPLCSRAKTQKTWARDVKQVVCWERGVYCVYVCVCVCILFFLPVEKCSGASSVAKSTHITVVHVWYSF